MAKYHVESSREIKAPLEKVFRAVLDLKTWKNWDPWIFTEPEASSKQTSPSDQAGAKSEWSGKIVGTGKLTITAVKNNEEICHKLEFFKPFKSQSTSYFRFEKAGDKTKVLWGMEGSLPFYLFFMKEMMNRSLAADFNLGLDRLAMFLDKDEEQYAIVLGDKESSRAKKYIGIRFEGSVENLDKVMPGDISKIIAFTESKGLRSQGPPFALYEKFNPKTGYTRGVTAIPVEQQVEEGDIIAGTLPALKTFSTTLKGPYSKLSFAWGVAFRVMQGKGYKMDKKMPFWEEYASDPQTAKKPLDIITKLQIPLKS